MTYRATARTSTAHKPECVTHTHACMYAHIWCDSREEPMTLTVFTPTTPLEFTTPHSLISGSWKVLIPVYSSVKKSCHAGENRLWFVRCVVNHVCGWQVNKGNHKHWIKYGLKLERSWTCEVYMHRYINCPSGLMITTLAAFILSWWH